VEHRIGYGMLLDVIIEPISDLSAIAAQSAVEYIADHSSLRRDGWTLTAIRILVACFVFLAVAVGVPILLIGLLWWGAVKIFFP
jgi:hypothetical protein